MYNPAPELAKLKRLGVSVSVKFRAPEEKDKVAILATESLKPKADGLIFKGENKTERAFSLVVKMPTNCDLVAVVIHGKKSEFIDRLFSMRIEKDLLTFVRNVSTYPVFGGYSTKPQDNSVRIVSVKNGLLQIFSIAVTTRLYPEDGAHDFLVVQEMYRAKLFRSLGELVAEDEIVTDTNEYPGFNKWDAMKELVGEMISSEKRRSLPVFKPRIKVLPKEPIFADKEGEVIFFDINKGFGFAKTKWGACYFSWLHTDVEDSLPYFFAGQKITYGLMEFGPVGQDRHLSLVRPA